MSGAAGTDFAFLNLQYNMKNITMQITKKPITPPITPPIIFELLDTTIGGYSIVVFTALTLQVVLVVITPSCVIVVCAFP